MFCHNCGTKLPDGSAFCPNCGNKVREPGQTSSFDETGYTPQESQPITWPDEEGGPFRYEEGVCPQCGSYNCEIHVQQNVSGGKNFSTGLGCLGFLLAGPFGILCGLCGGTQAKTTHQSMWVCKDCGHQFPTREGKIAELNLLASSLGTVAALGGIALILILFLMCIGWENTYRNFFDGVVHIVFAAFVTLGITAALCSPFVLGIKRKVKQYGYDSIEDFLTPSEMSNLKKTCVIGPAISVIFVLCVLVGILS